MESVRNVFDDVLSKTDDPDNPVLRAVIQATDPEVTAWAWAAGKALGLPVSLIIADNDYQGNGADIRLMLQMGRYAGIHGLTHAGFTHHSRLVAEILGRRVYPDMEFWLQPAAWESESAL